MLSVEVLMVKALIENLVKSGYEVSIRPERRTNEWLGVNAVCFSVAVWKDGNRLSGSIHRLLSEAMREASELALESTD